MATVSAPMPESPEQRFLLRGVDWQEYRTISQAFSGRHLRLTFDRGNLEFMTISRLHGTSSRLLGRFVFVLAEEFGLPFSSCGDMTCDRPDLERGVEPDESFYIVNEPAIRDKEQIDLSIDPPPDLVAEIDISRSSRNRLEIYAAMRVPEVWQYDGQTLRVWQLGADGRYQATEGSRYFPGIPIADIVPFLHRRSQIDEVALVREFRAWVQAQLARAGKP